MVKLTLLVAATCLLAAAASPADEIRAVLDAQMAAWNRGDLVAFADGYKDSPDTLFIGHTIARGRAQLLDRYRKTYSDRDKMGALRFSDLEIFLLDKKYANVVGHFHLERTAAAGGNADGVFTLLFERTLRGWKIIQDHTS